MEVGVVLLVLLGVGLAALAIAWHFSRSQSLLGRWAQDNGYRIVEQSYRTFLKGPFFWTTSRGQTVYHVTVEDAQDHRRSGWVRCGGWVLGLWSDKFEVRWDD